MSQKSKNLLQFFKLVGKLKVDSIILQNLPYQSIPRTGWVLRGVNNPESIAGHMYRMGIMALLIPESSGLDVNKCVKLALVHDIAECIVGDLTPFCGISPEEKHSRENQAITEMSKLIYDSDILTETYKEYELQESAEAKLVKELDRLDMIIQAFEYESDESQSLDLQEFFDSTRGKFQNPWILEIIQELYSQRDEQRKSKNLT